MRMDTKDKCILKFYHINWIPLLVLIAIFTNAINSQYLDNNENIYRTANVQPTPALDFKDRDVATVLLVDNNNRGGHGRFLNVKPAVGLLTSTARTFIQEGITTEYATQVLGTTLNNGKLYAQLLTKSSRVLYDGDNDVRASIKSSHLNDIIPNNNWNIANSASEFIKNTDDFNVLDINPAFIVYPTRSEILLNNYDTILKLTNDNYDDESGDINNRKDILYRNKDSITKTSDHSNDDISGGGAVIVPNKVRPKDNLPTFTIRNEFSPSGFSLDHQLDNVKLNENSKLTKNESRLGKKLFLNNKNIKDNEMLNENNKLNELKTLTSVTYYGFADFTTIVGDTIIIFSPSTSPMNLNAHITSIKGEATLQHENNLVIKPTTRLNDGYQILMTAGNDRENDLNVKKNEEDDIVEDIDVDDNNDEDDGNDDDDEITTKHDDENLNITENLLSIDNETTEENLINNIDGIEPSEVSVTSSVQMLSTPSNEDISKIFASLASKAAEESEKLLLSSKSTTIKDELMPTSLIVSDEFQVVTSISSSTSFTSLGSVTTLSSSSSSSSAIENVEIKIEPETQYIGGATTIFFDDDPFYNLEPVTPHSVVNDVVVVADDDKNKIDNDFTTTIRSTSEIYGNDYDDDTTISTISDQENLTDIIPVTTTEMNVDADENLVETTTLDNEITTIETNGIEENEMKGGQNDEVETKEEEKPECEVPLKLVPSTIFKTLTYLTTFFIPINDYETTTSIESNHLLTSEVSYNLPTDCRFNPSKIEFLTEPTSVSSSSVDRNLASEMSTSVISTTSESTTSSVTTMKTHVQEFDTSEELNNDNDDDEEDDEDDIDDETIEEDDSIKTVLDQPKTEKNLNKIESTVKFDEIELIYKTLYTTYTYLTTFFHDTTSSISSRKEVVTNIVSSTLSPSLLKSDNLIAGLVSAEMSINNNNNIKIKPTSILSAGIGRPTINNFIIQESDLAGIDNIIAEQDNSILIKPTPNLLLNNDENDLKTYYTTYTYFTTIFVDGETEISSRTEVYTNYVNIDATSTLGIIDSIDNKYSTMIRSADKLEVLNELNDKIKMITDVKSSSSDGERTTKIIENRQTNNLLLEDQISSESNTEEIIPAPLLLEQTSYTTFTFYTTMYIGSTSSNILSRLETITNVVTEKLPQTQTLQVDDSNLPITYFTTFTFWTTLFKDGSTITTSREETLSNIIEPSQMNHEMIEQTIQPTLNDEFIVSSTIEPSSVLSSSELTTESKLEPTTYYTTYTYFTTSYIGDETVLNSRFETVTNIVEPTQTPPIDFEKKPTSTEKILLSDDYVTITDEIKLKQSTGVVSLNHGKIIDADGVSTLYYTTKAIGQYINDLYAQIIESTSSLDIDTLKQKEIQATQDPQTVTSAGRQHKTGLVRSIDGTIIYNRTTTLYQSKVIGTIIDGRYAQIIESSSKLVIEKTIEPILIKSSINPSNLINLNIESTKLSSPASIESSINDDNSNSDDLNTEDDEFDDEFDEDDEDDDDDDDDDGSDGNSRKKSRLTFQTRKRTFTPVIRPFASRNRPTFNPKRKSLSPSSATIITRSDFTPTITATPALKFSDTPRGRFNANNNRRASSSNIQFNGGASTSSRRFLRPRGSSTLQSQQLSTFNSGSSRLRQSSTLPRNISPSSINNNNVNNNLLSSSKRINNFRGSSSVRPQLASTLFSNNPRFNRIRPTLSSNLIYNSQTINQLTTQNPNYNDDGITDITEDPTDSTNNDNGNNNNNNLPTTTELVSSRRNQNPLLRFKRPPFNARSSGTSLGQTTQRPAVTVTTRRSSILSRTRQTTAAPQATTPPTTVRPLSPFNRPANLNNLSNRPRTINNLFPPRGLLRPTQVNQEIQPNNTENEENLNNEEDDLNVKLIDDDIEYDGSEQDEVIEESETVPSIKIEKQRVKRQIEYGTRSPSYTPRFRRPTTVRSKPVEEKTEKIIEDPIQDVLSKQRASNRYQPRSRTLNLGNSNTSPSVSSPRIRPTSSLNPRSQFTLREKDVNQNIQTSSRPSFRRPTTTSSRRKPTSVSSPVTQSSRPKSPRLRSYSSSEQNTNNYSSRNTNSRARTNTQPTRGRTTTRQRGRQQDNFDYTYVQPSFDGTITVTHHIPTEITIPVVNGKITEYKNIVTAKISTEILGPKQYSTSTRNDGSSILVLSNDVTGINNNGITEITHFVLNETPTTSVTFTPTTIRGRRTSYSHIIPSTIYDVEQVITTIQPQIAANAPLANILLSQLLLGNLQQNINPLLALQQQQQQQIIPMTPTTEFKTKTTTYVTTVTSSTSTVIPLTFRGKEILTTIVDSSIDVITATEFLTETIIVQPTQIPQQQQQLNSLLIPLLLQQQNSNNNNNLMSQQNLNQQQIGQQNFLNLSPNNLQNTKLDEIDEIYINKNLDELISVQESEEYPEQETAFEEKKYLNNRNKLKLNRPPQHETSVVTLYVSGRRPGEFSTILSTVIVGQESTLRKRSINDNEMNIANYNIMNTNYNDYDLLSYDNYINLETSYLNDLNKKHTDYLDMNMIINTKIKINVTPSYGDATKILIKSSFNNNDKSDFLV